MALTPVGGWWLSRAPRHRLSPDPSDPSDTSGGVLVGTGQGEMERMRAGRTGVGARHRSWRGGGRTGLAPGWWRRTRSHIECGTGGQAAHLGYRGAIWSPGNSCDNAASAGRPDDRFDDTVDLVVVVQSWRARPAAGDRSGGEGEAGHLRAGGYRCGARRGLRDESSAGGSAVPGRGGPWARDCPGSGHGGTVGGLKEGRDAGSGSCEQGEPG